MKHITQAACCRSGVDEVHDLLHRGLARNCWTRKKLHGPHVTLILSILPVQVQQGQGLAPHCVPQEAEGSLCGEVVVGDGGVGGLQDASQVVGPFPSSRARVVVGTRPDGEFLVRLDRNCVHGTKHCGLDEVRIDVPGMERVHGPLGQCGLDETGQ